MFYTNRDLIEISEDLDELTIIERFLRPLAGEGAGRLELPAGPGELSLGPASAEEIGGRLFRLLFTGEIGRLYHASRAKLPEGEGLRLVLKLDPRNQRLAEVAGWPWELLFDRDGGRFLALDPRTPVVRSLDVRQPVAAAPRGGELRILAAAAAPRGLAPLGLEREVATLTEAWQGVPGVTVDVLRGASRQTLREKLLEGLDRGRPHHVLHFIGHGDVDPAAGEGVLVFETAEGRPELVPGVALAAELNRFSRLRLVFLNACSSGSLPDGNAFAGVAAALVQGGLPAVVAMRRPIPDRAGLELTRVFYQRLARGETVDAALTEGRLALDRLRTADSAWATPLLFSRSRDGCLFRPGEPAALPWWRSARNQTAAVLAALLAAGALLTLTLPQDAAQALTHAAAAADAARQGRYEAALEEYRAAAELNPEEARHHYNLGSLLAQLERWEEALPALRRAVDLEPNLAAAYNELASVHRRLGRLEDARDWIEDGLSADPSFAPLHRNLARLALEEGRHEEALRALDDAARLDGGADEWDRQEIRFLYARARLGLGQVEAGCRELARLAALDPVSIGPWTVEGLLRAEQHDCDSKGDDHA
mgnify:CR=1 FL=1